MDSSHSKRKVNGGLTAGDDVEDRAVKRRKFPVVSLLSSLHWKISKHFEGCDGAALIANWRWSQGTGASPPKFLATTFEAPTLSKRQG